MKNYFKIFLTLLFISVIPANLFSQKDSAWEKPPFIQLSGFVDVFYTYDLNQPKTNYRQTYFYNYNRHNEFNLNLGYIKFGVEQIKYRANITLQAGTYPNDNYASEPGLLKNIYEANIGITLNRKNNLWLDAGIFASHIGFETAISLDNWSLTRSILAESSPYYLSGAKLTFTPNNKWEIAALACNGWQHIQKVSGNFLPSFGTQIKFIPIKKNILNWSTFIGTDDPDTTRRMRYFSNFYSQFQFGKHFGLIAGFDIGTQQQAKNSSQYKFWLSPIIIVRYSITNKWGTAFRAEYYQDETGIVIPTGTVNGFKTTGLSLNIDYLPISNIACRIESRWLYSQDKIFEQNQSPTNNNLFITASIAVKFNQLSIHQ